MEYYIRIIVVVNQVFHNFLFKGEKILSESFNVCVEKLIKEL